ncbi:hypothetical protein KKG52_02850 [Patescibacteria group bacterium]|nr:hypothetical protein [Patescibacteria group bacterium]
MKEIHTGQIRRIPTRAEEEAVYKNPIHYLLPEHNGKGNGSSPIPSVPEASTEEVSYDEIADIAHKFYGDICKLSPSGIQDQISTLRENPNAVSHIKSLLNFTLEA